MTPSPTERKLAAILSADVVGYSRLMAEDEAGTIRTVTDYREAISMLVRQHRGRVVDAPGDNLLAEFPTALDAVQAAVEIQRVIGARNLDLPAGRRMEFRIGVHLGDISVEGERVYGEGVNITARLEGLAEPGGVCISGTVQEQVRHKLEVGYEDLGEQSVKNIPEPVRAYRVRPEAPVPTPVVGSKARPRALLVAGVVGLLIVAGVLLWRLPTTAPAIAPVDEQFTVPGFGGLPAIAVLPFDNLSDDPDQEYFADGIAEDLITGLSRHGNFPVIARNSSFAYRGQAIDVKRVGRELDVGYVVEGSVRRVGERVRITAQLIDAATGRHVWAESYDRELSDVLALQDEVTLAIRAALGFGLLEAETASALRHEVGDLNAWQAVWRGRWHANRGEWDEALSFFEKGRELDPSLAVASFGSVATMAAYSIPAAESDELSERLVRDAVREAERCLELHEMEPFCHLAMGVAQRTAGERNRAIAAFERAIEIEPGSAMAYGWLGLEQAITGRPDEALTNLEKALRLSPRDPMNRMWLDAMGWAHFGAHRYREAIEVAERTRSLHPRNPYAYRTLAASYGQLGRLDEARAALREELRLEPDLSLAKVQAEIVGIDPGFSERWLDGLRIAGLKEE